MPPVAVLLATYNGAKYIRELLDSLVAQNHRNLTLFVRDDGSSDGTLEIVRSYASRLTIEIVDDGVRLGPAMSFLTLLRVAGDEFGYFLFADQDDYWEPHKIERALERLAPHDDEVAMYCSRLKYVDHDLSPLKLSRVPRLISLENALVENIAVGCTMALNRRTRRLVLDHLPERTIMHDWWAYLVATAFGKVVYDEVPSIRYRQHGGNVLGAPTNFAQDFIRRVRLFLRRGGVFRLSEQALQFERSFERVMTPAQKDLVQRIRDGKGRLAGRLRLAFASPFVRQRKIDTLILRCVFLSGRF
jgi:glycosyltransferase involved in cell wall biosynthesis